MNELVGMANTDLLEDTAPHTHVGCTDQYYTNAVDYLDAIHKGNLNRWLTVSYFLEARLL